MIVHNQINQACSLENALEVLQDSRIETLSRHLCSEDNKNSDRPIEGEFSLDPQRATNNTWHSHVSSGDRYYPQWFDYIPKAIAILNLIPPIPEEDISIWHELGFTLQADHQIDGYMAAKCPCYSKSKQFFVSPDLSYWNCYTCGKEGGHQNLRQLITDINDNPDWEGLCPSDRDKLKLQMELTQKFQEAGCSTSRSQCVKLAEIAISTINAGQDELSQD